MLNALADDIGKHIKRLDGWIGKVEGRPADGWIVFDVGSIVVHLFIPEQREYYQLETLWHEGKVLLRVQ